MRNVSECMYSLYGWFILLSVLAIHHKCPRMFYKNVLLTSKILESGDTSPQLSTKHLYSPKREVSSKVLHDKDLIHASFP